MRATLLPIVGLMAALACGGDISPPVRPAAVSSVTFARVLGSLVVARSEALPDTAEYRRRRAAILQQANVTAEDLERFVDARGGDSDLMAAIYERASARLDTLAVRQSPP